MAEPMLFGSFRALILYDVAEEIDLGKLRTLIGAEPRKREPEFKRPAPEYVRFERTPVMEPVEPVVLEGGDKFEARMKYYDYGVVSIELDLPFESNWRGLIELSSRWVGSSELERGAVEIVRRRVAQAAPALVKPSGSWLNEDYYIMQLGGARGDGEDGGPLTAAELTGAHAGEIAQIIRGESQPLSLSEQKEILQGSISYYPTDFLVAGWTAALIYDTPEGAEPTIQLLEYANSQLLEFRHYDDVLTRVLADVYRLLDEKRGFLSRWRMARQAEWLNTIRLDITELTERADNSIKFLSDMFYARVYRLVSGKVGVPDYRNLVEEKLRTAGELYTFMVDQFHQARAFATEMTIILILVIELIPFLIGLLSKAR